MSITVSEIENLAPDQASLKAASKLKKPAKWPLLAKDETGGSLIWGECQGSGANPYRVVVDSDDLGYKCTCPSRKFPCKHSLALMWLFSESPELFQTGEVPEWVNDWVARRRGKGVKKPQENTGGKNIQLADVAEVEKKLDPKEEARKKAAAEKREQNKKLAITAATEELESWIQDQLKAGISNLQKELAEKCRKIAARLVDGKAGALASRLDELPSRILELPATLQTNALIGELGQLKLLIAAWHKTPDAPDLYRSISTSENKQAIVENPDAPRVKATWEVLRELIRSRRDGLIEQATWLMRLDGEESDPPFALLLDFFPVTVGKRSQVHMIGDQFIAELAFYPGQYLERAILVERQPSLETPLPWKKKENANSSILAPYRSQMAKTPWIFHFPLKLGAGRLAKDSNKNVWWCPENPNNPALLVEDSKLEILVFGLEFSDAVGLWNGFRLQLLAAQSKLGRITFDD